MNIKFIKSILSFIPCIIILIGYFLYSYGDANPDTLVATVVSSIISGYQDTTSNFSTLLSLNNKQEYLETVAIVEEEDIIRIEEEQKALQLLNAKNGVADLNNWILPIVGNYTITTYYENYHKGIDYYSYYGYNSDILAANNGVVYTTVNGCIPGDLSCNGGRGNYIVINHNNSNYYTMYMHLNKINVNIGEIVSSGDVIGTMGNSGYVIPTPTSSNPYGGTHLHFEVFIGIPDKGGYRINPLNLY